MEAQSSLKLKKNFKNSTRLKLHQDIRIFWITVIILLLDVLLHSLSMQNINSCFFLRGSKSSTEIGINCLNLA